MSESDQERVLRWRSAPEVSGVMYTQLPTQSLASQLKWFRSVSENKRFRYWIIENRGQPVGVANLADLAPEHSRTDWAFYLGDRESQGKGVGARVEYAVIFYALFHLGLEKLSCQVLSNNPQVAQMHKKFGFVEEGVLRRHYCINSEWLDVYLLALYAHEARTREYDKATVRVKD